MVQDQTLVSSLRRCTVKRVDELFKLRFVAQSVEVLVLLQLDRTAQTILDGPPQSVEAAIFSALEGVYTRKEDENRRVFRSKLGGSLKSAQRHGIVFALVGVVRILKQTNIDSVERAPRHSAIR